MSYRSIPPEPTDYGPALWGAIFMLFAACMGLGLARLTGCV